MATLTIRNVPDDLLQQLKSLAERNRRSLQQQLLVLLEQTRILEHPAPVDRARRIRERLQNRPLGNVVDDVRKERTR